jgi:prepilin peptidase CpaA
MNISIESMVIVLPMLLLMAMVIYYDSTNYIIPNWLVLVVLALYPVAFLLADEKPSLLWAIGIGAGLFIAGFALFAFKLMGGGDVKLLAACGLWCGEEASFDLILGTAILGGVLSVVIILMRKVLAPYIFARFNCKTIPRIFTEGEPVPYGLAIAGTMIAITLSGKVALLS